MLIHYTQNNDYENMLDVLQIIVLAIVQGITEFLPVSSSAHLILIPKLFGWNDRELAFDVALHLGTLVAILHYFKKDLYKITIDFLRTGKSRLAWAIIIGTIPAGIVGLLCNDIVKSHLRNDLVIITSTILFGLLLAIADKKHNNRNLDKLTWNDIMLIGIFQSIALIPGTSRSGITITAGLFLGLSRNSASKYSFLLAIPIIILASGLEAINLYSLSSELLWEDMILGFIVAAITGYSCIKIFMKLIIKISMIPFVIYRLILAIVLLSFYLFGGD